jgi:hypothetical protein
VPIDLQRLAKEHGPQWNWAVIKDLMAQVGTTAPYMQLVLDLKERCAGDEEAVSQSSVDHPSEPQGQRSITGAQCSAGPADQSMMSEPCVNGLEATQCTQTDSVGHSRLEDSLADAEGIEAPAAEPPATLPYDSIEALLQDKLYEKLQQLEQEMCEFNRQKAVRLSQFACASPTATPSPSPLAFNAL